MYFIEKQLQELRAIDHPLTREPDFEKYWDRAAAKVQSHDSTPVMKHLSDYPYLNVRIYDTVVHGLDGTAVHAWVYIPGHASSAHKVPATVCLHGGGGHRGKAPLGSLPFLLAGYAVIIPEFRLQGGITGSNTPMNKCIGHSFATMNIDQEPENYYFYHAFTDQMLMVKLAMALEEVDADRVAVIGASQGGGTGMILSALNPRIALCLAAVPSYCCWERRIFTRTACAAEIARYLEAFPERTPKVFKTMSYFDAMNFADKIRCPVEVQCCLKDSKTPPECTFAAYNKITAPKNMLINPLGEHHDVNSEQWLFDLRKYFHGELLSKVSCESVSKSLFR